MAQIEEVIDDIKDGLGDKGFLIFIICAVAFGLYNLLKKDDTSSGELVTVTSVSSYPDAVTNANVIIDTLQNSIDYSQQSIQEDIQGWGEELQGYMSDNFEATNDYINSGLDSQSKLLEENFDSIFGDLDNLQNSQKSINSNITNLSGKVSGLQTNVNSLSGKVSGLQTNVNSLSGNVNTLKNAVSNMKQSYNAPSSSSSNKSTTSTIKYTTKSGLNTSTSIVDALKASGIDSSMANRKVLAEKNGIKNYTGTYEQNVAMLNKLKAGQLKG